MKVFMFSLLAFITLPTFADGKCVSQANKGAHEDFFNNLNQQTFGPHASLCPWDAGNPKFLKIAAKI